MARYANAVIHVKFPELSEDSESDPIWVVMRNPRMMPPHELKSDEDIPTDSEGKALDPDLAEKNMYDRLAKVVVGLRAYDASSVTVDELTGEMQPQELLKPPISVETIRKLPMEIIHKLSEVYVEALNPKSDPEPNTLKMSTLSLAPSSTEPGLAEASLLSSNTSS